MNERKSFFRERIVKEIRDLHVSSAYAQRGLVERIDTLDPISEALQLQTVLIPGRFFKGGLTQAEAARKCFKHGKFLALSQPRTQEEAYTKQEIPLAIRRRDFSGLEKMSEEEINFIGYSSHPVQGNETTKRVIPFVWLPEAERLFAYAENLAGGIKVTPYDDAKRVAKEGASIVCTVPSRTKKKSRYTLRLDHVPVNGVTERRAVIWSLRPHYETGEEPAHSLYNIRYTGEISREGSDVITFYPHDIAAYIAIAGEFWKNCNLTPMEMNPFALPSKHQAEFYKKLCNNVLVYDPSLKSKEKLRKPNLAEKSILLARAIGHFGHDDFALWFPERDGKLKDYNWTI